MGYNYVINIIKDKVDSLMSTKYTVLEFYHLIKESGMTVLKFNKYVIKYNMDMSGYSSVMHKHKIDMDMFSDYNKYRKVYRLIYGI